MKPTEWIQAIDRLFLDLIGNVVPGVFVIVGIWAVLGQPRLASDPAMERVISGCWWLLLLIGYAAGHGLSSLGELTVEPIAENALRLFGRSKTVARFVLRNAKGRQAIDETVPDEESFRAFTYLFRTHRGNEETPLPNDRATRKWRNIALSAEPRAEYITYRFMFISLLNLGMATAAALIFVSWALLQLAACDGQSIPLLSRLPNSVIGLALLLSVPYFMARRWDFYGKSMRVPFSMAQRKLMDQATKAQEATETSGVTHALAQRHCPMAIVYLAGGFHSGWQDQVMAAVPTLTYLDPRVHNLPEPDAYALWDLNAIRSCDCVFAYLERTNPAGYALALELGYAKALGKFVILVDEKSSESVTARRHLAMLVACADVTRHSLDDATSVLLALQSSTCSDA